MKPGTVLDNGAIVLDANDYKAGDGLVYSVLVLCVIPGREYDGFASWVVRMDNGAAMWGCYSETLTEAQAVYADRVQGSRAVGRIAA